MVREPRVPGEEEGESQGKATQRSRALLGLSHAGNAYDRARLSCWVSLCGFPNLSSLLGAPNTGKVSTGVGVGAWFLSVLLLETQGRTRTLPGTPGKATFQGRIPEPFTERE